MIAIETLQKTNGILNTFGPLIKDSFFIESDSRTYKGGAFICFKGESFNGLDYVDSVLAKDCRIIIFEKDNRLSEVEKLSNQYKDVSFICVENTLSFYQDLAHNHLKTWQTEKKMRNTIGITGSNGKTTNKEILYHLLSNVFPNKVWKSLKNFNNHIGVPQTILGVTEVHDIVILEMGTNHPGEIKRLCDIGIPNCGYIVNIGQSHLEFFKNEENVFHEKKALYDAVIENTDGDGIFIINGEDKYLSQLETRKNHYRIERKDFLKFKNNELEFVYRNETYNVKNPNLTGFYNFKNLVYAFCLCSELYPEKKMDFLKLLESYKPGNQRSEWLQLEDTQIFLDAYNANPSSMRCALEGFKEHTDRYKDPKILMILGQMNELGDLAGEYHRELSKYLVELFPAGRGEIFYVGNFQKEFTEGMGNRDHQVFRDGATLKKYLQSLNSLNNYDYIFLKGSRSLQLETIIDI